MNVKTYHARLRELPCIVCWEMSTNAMHGPNPSQELHHAGPADERNDWNVIPLCQEHHTGPNGIHGLHRRAFAMRYKLSDLQMLAITRELYAAKFE